MSKYDVKQEVTDKFSLRGRVFHKLREDILSGKYQEHEELKEVAIGEEMGVSRTPVREAFRQLELEGLIQIIPNKGAYVTGITQKDVKDIYMIRSLLEGLCARWATEHITKEQMEEMEENVYLSKFHAQKGHLEQLAELDNRFHDILYEACDSKMLEHQLKDFHQYVLRVRKKTLASANRGPKSNEEHEQISLTYYADGVLADENDEVIEDVEDAVGIDSLNHFGEYEDDSVFVRNDARKCDYEILLDQRTYSEVVEDMPHQMEV